MTRIVFPLVHRDRGCRPWLMGCYAVTLIAGSLGAASAQVPPPLKAFAHTGTVQAISFSPDSRYLLRGTANDIARDETYWEGQIHVWDTVENKHVTSMKIPQRVRSIAFSPKGDLLAVVSGRMNNQQPGYAGYKDKPGALQVFSFPDLKEKWGFEAGALGEACGFSPDGQLLAASFSGRGQVNDDRNGEVVVFSTSDAKVRKRIESSIRTPSAFSFSADGKLLMIMDYSREDRIANVVRFSLPGGFDEKPVAGENAFAGPSGEVQRSWKGRRLFRHTADGIDAIDFETGETLFSKGHQLGETTCFAINSDESLFAVGTMRPGRPPHRDAGVLIWDMQKDRQLMSWTWRDSIVPIKAIAFSPDRQMLAAGDYLYRMDSLRPPKK